jgi:hypothetical protein
MDYLKKVWKYFFDVSRVVLQVTAGGQQGRYVIPYEEWLSIKDWYYDRSQRDDYLLTLDDNVESYTLVRLNKDTSELKVWEINRVMIFTKNLFFVLLSPVPLIIRFFTAFFVALVIWPVVAPISFIKFQEFTAGAISLATRLTSLVFIAFLMFNLLYAIFKVVDASIYRFKAFIRKEDTFITDTLAFNLFFLALFAAIGGENLVKFAENFWNYINQFM